MTKRLWLITMFHSHSTQAGYGLCDLLRVIHASVMSNCSLPGLTHRSVSSTVNGWLQSLVDLTRELITVRVSIYIWPALPWCPITVYQTSRTVSVWAFPVSFPNCSYQSWSRHQIIDRSLLLLSTVSGTGSAPADVSDSAPASPRSLAASDRRTLRPRRVVSPALSYDASDGFGCGADTRS